MGWGLYAGLALAPEMEGEQARRAPILTMAVPLTMAILTRRRASAWWQIVRRGVGRDVRPCHLVMG